jgi:hypothetical protein
MADYETTGQSNSVFVLVESEVDASPTSSRAIRNVLLRPVRHDYGHVPAVPIWENYGLCSRISLSR